MAVDGFGVKRRVFISHYRGDRDEVEEFIDTFVTKHGVFTPYVFGANDNDDFVDSSDADYVMTQIRKKYLLDTTVTIVLVGKCTHSRRYVDWEIKTSLWQGQYAPNGLLGIILPSCGNTVYLPLRLQENWNRGHSSCYARYGIYPSSARALDQWIEDAYDARRSRANWIRNSRDMMKYNHQCRVHGVTH